ncbi:DUF192 domain-containing protein [Granulibacter bethesdensis]|uniref:Secreted protein n=1 Tax=Granulibacter bethesdensis (strain ATCC BAA-1260 / CGDNIH1) TaxID=391165 RepID=Q0BTN1_GRABC|nr:DUF192 domain-containing protein [Granulibacter bethesdensis]ABI61821.1 putative secreted protein [Granulibacter bethesdensis CGDNIH1]AHJ69295.1 putative secreted protein [Granulibacter bethesdensis]APH51632.1 putative secreted protein [Granulibacter bethesdensis]APH64325.1 putative secreted protein [Granulibacter bethesdensis]
MKRRFLLSVLAASPLIIFAPQAHALDDTKPQPEMKREPLIVHTHDGRSVPFKVEVAHTVDQQTIGLMWRTSVPADGGMLFDWNAPRNSQMWMRNTLVPLDMVFINEDGTIHAIAENTVPRSLSVIDSNGPVRATLELAAGTTEKNDIRVGDRITTPAIASMAEAASVPARAPAKKPD